MNKFNSLVLSSLFLAILLLSAGCDDNPAGSGGSLPGIDWRLVETGIPTTISSFAANDTLLVGIGNTKDIFYTTDGVNWSSVEPEQLDNGLNDVAWSGSQFVAVGWRGRVMTSPDGINWTRRNYGEIMHLRTVGCSDTLIVAFGDGVQPISSKDGIIWTVHPSVGFTSQYDILYDNNLWISCGQQGTIFYSADGIDWTETTSDIPSGVIFRSLTKTNSGYLAIGSMIAANTQGYGVIYSSSDGRNWSLLRTIESATIWSAFQSPDELLIGGSTKTTDYTGPRGLLLAGSDGNSLEQIEIDSPNGIEAISRIGDNLVVAGSGGYVFAGRQPSELTVRTSGTMITDVVWAGNRFVAITYQGTVMTSRDGESWREYHSHATRRFSKLAFSGQRFVAIGRPDRPGALFMSTNAIDWSPVFEEFDDYLIEPVWGGGQFIVIGAGGTVLRSYTGENWTESQIEDLRSINSICWDGKRYVALGYDEIHFSRYGRKWERQDLNIPDLAAIENIVWNGRRYLATGMTRTGPLQRTYNVYSSSDGINWNRHELGSTERIYNLAWTGYMYVLCGENGLLMTSRNGEDWTTIPNDAPRHLNAIGVSPRKIVVVGDQRTVLVSR